MGKSDLIRLDMWVTGDEISILNRMAAEESAHRGKTVTRGVFARGLLREVIQERQIGMAQLNVWLPQEYLDALDRMTVDEGLRLGKPVTRSKFVGGLLREVIRERLAAEGGGEAENQS